MYQLITRAKIRIKLACAHLASLVEIQGKSDGTDIKKGLKNELP